MRQHIFTVLALCSGLLTITFTPRAIAAEQQFISTFSIDGKVVHIDQGNYWGILSADGKKYDPGDVPKEFQHVDLQVRVEAKAARKRPARMWGKAIELVHIEKVDSTADPHAHHRQIAPGYQRSIQDYRIPDVKVVQANGETVSTANLFDTNKTIVVSFIFTSCSAICPVLTTTLAQTQQRLGTDAEHLRILSISIDPEHDSPAQLHDYAQRFKAHGDWQFLTGERTAIRELQQAFAADRGDKNNHLPLTLIRPAGQTRWVRLDGFTSADELTKEIRQRPET
jgi:protein SCO1/2